MQNKQRSALATQDIDSISESCQINPRELYQAALYGDINHVRVLVHKGVPINAHCIANTSGVSRDYLTPLGAAAFSGYLDIVKFLVEHGAKVNATSSKVYSPIEAAASGQRLNIMQYLIEKGADVDARNVEDRATALQSASHLGQLTVVKLLVRSGADVNAQGGKNGTALQAAVGQGNFEIVRFLLRKGARINATGGRYGNALQTAAAYGRSGILRFLVENGADVKATGGEYGTAHQAAAASGNFKMVEILTKKGADINASGGEYGNTLQAAATQRDLKLVEYLVKNGANVNAIGGRYGTALQAAAAWGCLKIVRYLVEVGADVTATGGIFGNALQAACAALPVPPDSNVVQFWGANDEPTSLKYGNVSPKATVHGGRLAIVKFLIENGADVNAKGGKYGTSLQAAAVWGSLEIVQLLVGRHANVNATGGEFGNALQAAAAHGKEALTTVEFLINSGANVNALGGEYGGALQAAAFRGCLSTVQLLVRNGADVNAVGGKYGSALQAAAAHVNASETIRFLIENGADVNAAGGEFGCAMQVAASRGCLHTVQFLINNRADVNAIGGRYGNPLQAAICGGSEEIVKLLVQEGADVNEQDGLYRSSFEAAIYGQSSPSPSLALYLLDKGSSVHIRERDKDGSTILHAPVTLNSIKLLSLVLERGAGSCIDLQNLSGETPIHVATKLGLLRALEDLEPCFSRGSLMVRDVDGRLPLHIAIENKDRDICRWLINRMATADIRDFSGTTLLKYALLTQDAEIISLVFPKTRAHLADISTTMWKRNLKADHIIMRLGEGAHIRGVSDEGLLNFLKEHYIPLGNSAVAMSSATVFTTEESIIPPGNISQRTFIALGRDIFGESQSQVGLHWNWWRWRKILVKHQDLHERGRELGTWIWKMQPLEMRIPSRVAVSQTPPEQGFLIFHVSLPSTSAGQRPSNPEPHNVSGLLKERKHHMIWLMYTNHKSTYPTPPQLTGGKRGRKRKKKANPNSRFEVSSNKRSELISKLFLSTMEFANPPSSPIDLFLPLVDELSAEWATIFNTLNEYLIFLRGKLLASKGRNAQVNNALLEASKKSENITQIKRQQMEILRSLYDVYTDAEWSVIHEQNEQERLEFCDRFGSAINDMEVMVDGVLQCLARTLRELIQLEFNITSIAEAQESRSISKSMKRLSWITFIFLPLMFIAVRALVTAFSRPGVFGMNVDTFAKHTPPLWYYIPAGAAAIFVTLFVWRLWKWVESPGRIRIFNRRKANNHILDEEQDFDSPVL